MQPTQPEPTTTPGDETDSIRTARVWQDPTWTARVVKNEDDDGWAVEMYTVGQSEPALVGPWTMGRDKKNPKPLDSAAFNTLVKTASEVLRRHEQQLHARLHKSVAVEGADGPVRITLDIVADDDDPHARLAAHDAAGQRLAECRVRADWRLDPATARAWIDAGFARPR